MEQLPRLWTIKPCRVCRRPLTLVWFLGRPRTYRLHSLLDVGGAIYGLSTLDLITAFILSEMNARTFAKIVTILLFVFGSLLLVDGVLGFGTRIDRTWSVVRRGGIAKLIGGGKAAAGMTAFGLVLVGLTL
ncbi:hypothetical protein [Sphingomonas sp. CFBP 8760]|uniref:hypothetical protein n=1 Tax=Sphingomonas sp. CFBP 8760 TaxID=2775282 RepID=UPI001A926688|nr:hypothetical protein [Sphingomonas sp. CFBP 8760]